MKVFMIAGEASGDRLGAAFIRGLKSLVPNVEFLGIAGQEMQREGMVSQFDMSELSIMGIAEVAPKYFQLKRRIQETAEAVIAAQPDVLMTIDSPDFCLRVAKIVKQHFRALNNDIPIVHYVAPSVWAWRPKRAQKMAKWVDHVLALLPFEPPYMHDAQMSCDFVGHPVVSETIATQAQIDEFRGVHGIGTSPLVLALPGSRRGEITRLASRFGKALGQLQHHYPDLKIVLPAAPNVEQLVKDMTDDWAIKPIIISPDQPMQKMAAFGAADIALAASGTVSLELAASATPMVIAYDMNWLSRILITRMLKVDTVTLTNLVSETRVVPEFLGAKCQPELIANAMISVLKNSKLQSDALSLTMKRLGKDGDAPGLRAAQSVLQFLETRNATAV